MRVHCWVVFACLASASAYFPAQSHACSCATPRVATLPTNSQSGFPRNQAIKLRGPLDPESVVLQKVDGTPHGFEKRWHATTGFCEAGFVVELIPTPALDPDTHYELRAMTRPIWGGHQEPHVAIRFSTSSELLPDPELTRPSAALTLAALPDNFTTTCGRYAATGCLTVKNQTDVSDLLLVYRDGDKVFHESTLEEVETSLMLSKMPTCIDVVRTSPTGRRSPPLSFCGNDLKTIPKPRNECEGSIWFEATRRGDEPRASDPPAPADASGRAGSAAPSQPRAADSHPMHHEYGCTAVSGRMGDGLAGFALLSLVAVFAARRRR